MLTLRQALDALAPILAPSARFSRPKLMLRDGALYAYNGLVAARAPFAAALPSGCLVLDAEGFGKVWRDDCVATLSSKDQLILKTRRTRYALPVLGEFEVDIPQTPDATEPLTLEARDAIHMAARFASENAVHPWANGVTLHQGRAIATNNIAVVSVECAAPFEGTLPFWAVETLRKDGPLPCWRMDAHGLVVTYADGVTFWSMPLAAEMPAKLFELVADLAEGEIPVAPLREALDEAFALGGRLCKLDLANARMLVSAEHGFSAETELALPLALPDCPPIVLQEVVARTVLETATHLGFSHAPQRLEFSRDVAPCFRGLASAMVGGM